MTVNESAATYRWLTGQFGIDDPNPANPVRAAWNGVRADMLAEAGSGQLIQQSVEWVSDYWVSRGAASIGVLGQIAPTWAPPDGIDQWPAFEVGRAVAVLSGAATRSNHPAFSSVLGSVGEPSDAWASETAALHEYSTLKAGLVPRVWDVPAMVTEHVRAWLDAALGPLLSAAAFSPQDDLAALARAVVHRVRLVPQVADQGFRLVQLGDRDLEVLYNARMLADGRVQLSAVRTGQGGEWRDHWLALCFDLSTESTLAAVQMAARLLRCPSLVLGLASAITPEDPRTSRIAVAVIRRWLLTLRAMAWLETSLQHHWTDVRSKDLCCFALNAVKPDWPRRAVAVSHRSRDVKPALRTLDAWRSARFAIDANYVPSWETNVGMIWGLFAPTPAIVRVLSPSYADSVWCRRELELTDYLLKESDFLTERWIVDLEPGDLRRLDQVGEALAWGEPGFAGVLSEFPPVTEVCSPSPLPPWEARMLRAGAALRSIHVYLPGAQPDLANALALHLQQGGDLPGPAPTNNPGGWQTYGKVFRDVRDLVGAGDDELAVRLPDDYGEAERQVDAQLLQRVPDLQTGIPSLDDVLVALEWLRVEYPLFVERRRGDFLAINCQRLSRELWESREELSLHRGLAAMRQRLPVPLWVIQRADQDVEMWPLIGDVPIFTEHVDAQFVWMWEAAFDRRACQQRYAQDSRMVLLPTLAEKCRGAGDRSV